MSLTLQDDPLLKVLNPAVSRNLGEFLGGVPP
jgi:hypothetical protein